MARDNRLHRCGGTRRTFKTETLARRHADKIYGRTSVWSCERCGRWHVSKDWDPDDP